MVQWPGTKGAMIASEILVGQFLCFLEIINMFVQIKKSSFHKPVPFAEHIRVVSVSIMRLFVPKMTYLV